MNDTNRRVRSNKKKNLPEEANFVLHFTIYARDALHSGTNLIYVREFTANESLSYSATTHPLKSMLLPKKQIIAERSETPTVNVYNDFGSGDRPGLTTSGGSILVASTTPATDYGGGDCQKVSGKKAYSFVPALIDINQLNWKITCQRTRNSGKGIELTVELTSRPILPFRTKIYACLEQILPEYSFNERLNLVHLFSEDDAKLGPITIVPEVELEALHYADLQHVASPNDWHCPGCDSWQDKLMCDNCTAGETIYYCFFCREPREFGVFAYNDDEFNDDGADRCPTCHAFNVHSLRFSFLNPHGNLRCRLKINVERVEVLSGNTVMTKWMPSIAESSAWPNDCATRSFDSLSDFTIVARDNVRHKVHKSIIASRCDYFRRMLSHKFCETQQSIWNIDCCSLACVDHLIHHFYTDRFPIKSPIENTLIDAQQVWQEVIELLTLANMYGLERLKNQCEAYFYPRVTINNACELLIYADLFNARQLRQFLASFCQHHLHEVMKSSGWERMCYPEHCHLIYLVTLGRELPISRKRLCRTTNFPDLSFCGNESASVELQKPAKSDEVVLVDSWFSDRPTINPINNALAISKPRVEADVSVPRSCKEFSHFSSSSSSSTSPGRAKARISAQREQRCRHHSPLPVMPPEAKWKMSTSAAAAHVLHDAVDRVTASSRTSRSRSQDQQLGQQSLSVNTQTLLPNQYSPSSTTTVRLVRKICLAEGAITPSDSLKNSVQQNLGNRVQIIESMSNVLQCVAEPQISKQAQSLYSVNQRGYEDRAVFSSEDEEQLNGKLWRLHCSQISSSDENGQQTKTSGFNFS